MTQVQASRRRPLWARIFLSPDEPRLRAGWRLLIQTLSMVILAIPINLLLFSVSGLQDISSQGFLLGQIGEFLLFFSSIYLARRFLDRRSFVSLGVKVSGQALLDVAVGIGITFIMMGAIYLAMAALGWSKFESFAWQSESAANVLLSSLTVFVVFILVGWNEELLSRGYHLQTLASGLNLTWGVILSSAIFGVLHIFNPSATWVSVAGIFLAGLFLAYAYLRTRQLWLSIGLHIGWNFFEGTVFGFPVSGLETYRLLHQQVQGPELWTGGAFGPEAGLIVLPALALGAGLIYVYTNMPRKSAE